METKEERMIKLFGRIACIEGKLNPEISATELTERVYKIFKEGNLL